MKKYICLFFLFSISIPVFCQDVMINGINNNRLLTWEDFTGKPDNHSLHDANTKWNLSYSYQGYTLNGDYVKIKGLKMILELDQRSSWIKPGKETVPLLKHEQGHFDIGLICLQEMTARLNNASYYKNVR
ncbi:MAG: hypothetical protein IPL50_11110 [Chitinophagaceae bacterium]|nr:hypothetical protein [Chitinophagaceae bacterium]